MLLSALLPQREREGVQLGVEGIQLPEPCGVRWREATTAPGTQKKAERTCEGMILAGKSAHKEARVVTSVVCATSWSRQEFQGGF